MFRKHYTIKEDGTIYRRGKKCKTFINGNYERVSIDKKVYSVHRLVAKAYVYGDWELTVHHINFNPKDNRSCNLMWCTHKENLQFSEDRMI